MLFRSHTATSLRLGTILSLLFCSFKLYITHISAICFSAHRYVWIIHMKLWFIFLRAVEYTIYLLPSGWVLGPSNSLLPQTRCNKHSSTLTRNNPSLACVFLRCPPTTPGLMPYLHAQFPQRLGCSTRAWRAAPFRCKQRPISNGYGVRSLACLRFLGQAPRGGLWGSMLHGAAGKSHSRLRIRSSWLPQLHHFLSESGCHCDLQLPDPWVLSTGIGEWSYLSAAFVGLDTQYLKYRLEILKNREGTDLGGSND